MTLSALTAEMIEIGGFEVKTTTAVELTRFLDKSIPAREGIALFFANTNFVVKCEGLSASMRHANVVIVNDGIGLEVAARLFAGSSFPENMNGTDFTPRLISRAGRRLRIFMLGGRPDILAGAVQHVNDLLGQDVVGSCDGYRDLDGGEVIARIASLDVDVVLVALGNPLQEAWILRHGGATQAGVLIGVGALFDLWAGGKRRAPHWMRVWNLEWLFRLTCEPRRLLPRYTIDIARFIWVCFRRRSGEEQLGIGGA